MGTRVAGWPERLVLQPQATPVQALDRLARHLGRDEGELLIKRDDLTLVAGGGGKVRKLEFAAAACGEGADTLLTLGGVQSNAARATAAVACSLGMRCCLVLVGRPPSSSTGNVLLDRLFGAEIRWCDVDDPRSEREVLADEAVRLRANGQNPFIIPSGVSTGLGALGYVRAADELTEQVPDLDVVVTATGTGATQAGLAAGLGRHDRVLGVRIGSRRHLRDRIDALAGEAASLVGRSAPTGEPVLDDDHLGLGYGDTTEAGFEAMSLVARLEGLVLDPVYTGKSMAALLTHLREERIPHGSRTVFLHTGGVPGLFAHHESAWVSSHFSTR